MSSLRKVYRIRIATKTLSLKGTQSINNMLYTLSESLYLSDFEVEFNFFQNNKK